MTAEEFQIILKISKNIHKLNTLNYSLEEYNDYLKKTLEGEYEINVQEIAKDIEDIIYELIENAEKFGGFLENII